MALSSDTWVYAQQSVLGSMLIDERCVAQVMAETSEQDFQGPQLTIYRTMRKIFLEGRSVDPVAVVGVLGDGYKKFILELMEVTPTAANVSQYVGVCREQARMIQATKLLGRQAGATLDTVVRNILHSGTNVVYCPKQTKDESGNVTKTEVTSRADLDKTAVLTMDVVKKVVAILRGQNAPTVDGKNYVAIIHPYAAYDIMSDPKWEDAHKYTDAESIYAGEIGRIAGVRFVETTEAKIYTGTGCPAGLAVFGTLFLGQNAYGVTEVTGGGLQTIVKQKGSAGTADPLDQRSSVGWKAILTAEMLVQSYMVRVESCSPEFSATAQAN